MLVLRQSRKEEQTTRAQKDSNVAKGCVLVCSKETTPHVPQSPKTTGAAAVVSTVDSLQPRIAFQTYEPGAFLCILLFSLWGSLHVIWFPPTVQGEEPLVNLLIIFVKMIDFFNNLEYLKTLSILISAVPTAVAVELSILSDTWLPFTLAQMLSNS